PLVSELLSPVTLGAGASSTPLLVGASWTSGPEGPFICFSIVDEQLVTRASSAVSQTWRREVSSCFKKHDAQRHQSLLPTGAGGYPESSYENLSSKRMN